MEPHATLPPLPGVTGTGEATRPNRQKKTGVCLPVSAQQPPAVKGPGRKLDSHPQKPAVPLPQGPRGTPSATRSGHPTRQKRPPPRAVSCHLAVRVGHVCTQQFAQRSWRVRICVVTALLLLPPANAAQHGALTSRSAPTPTHQRDMLPWAARMRAGGEASGCALLSPRGVAVPSGGSALKWRPACRALKAPRCPASPRDDSGVQSAGARAQLPSTILPRSGASVHPVLPHTQAGQAGQSSQGRSHRPTGAGCPQYCCQATRCPAMLAQWTSRSHRPLGQPGFVRVLFPEAEKGLGTSAKSCRAPCGCRRGLTFVAAVPLPPCPASPAGRPGRASCIWGISTGAQLGRAAGSRLSGGRRSLPALHPQEGAGCPADVHPRRPGAPWPRDWWPTGKWHRRPG